MLPKDFRRFFLENTLDFLWRQWSCLGVAGSIFADELWAIDPEALLPFTLTMTRYEPRLFDEVCDWLTVNAKLIDNQRLRGIVKTKNEETKRLISAVAALITDNAGSYRRKWQPLSRLAGQVSNETAESLFITKDGKPHPGPREESRIFKAYGFVRGPIRLRKMSKPANGNTWSNIRILLRSLFGIGSRAECVLYLLTHEAGHPTEVARAIGVSVRAAQDTLIELAESDLVLTRRKGKRTIEYWLPQKRWWQFLSGINFEDTKKAVWINWIAVFTALTAVWEVLAKAREENSEYMRISKLHEAMNTIRPAFAESNIGLSPTPGSNIPPGEYEEAFQDFIIQVLGAKSGSTNR